MSSATWWTSRTSPASTTSATLVRVAERRRWWCTAEVSSSDGIGAHAPLESRSETITYSTPRATAAETFSQISAIRARRDSAPPSGRYRPRTLRAAGIPSSPSRCRNWSSWSLSMTGKSTATWRVRTRSVVSRLPEGPTEPRRLVTSSSRMASSGGLVTWAKDCTK